MKDKPSLDDIVSLCKRRGFIYQGSEIYGGVTGTWDYGPLGALLKKNIREAWLKNFVDSFQPDLPFGIAQVGKAFRNEISPRDFIFRVRELEIMEFEFFIKPAEWEKHFEKWHKDMYGWFEYIGLP